MKRINNSDIRINILGMNLPEKFTFQFYTVDENVNINRTEEDVDSEGFVNLDWSLLQLLGEGVMSYILTKHIPDTSYPDGYYDVTITRATNYYIVTDVEPIPPEQSGQTLDIIIDIIDEYSKYTNGLVSAETENRIEADNAISGSVSNLDERVTALENIDLSEYATKTDLQDGVEDAEAYTREYAYNKTEVDEKIASIDTSNYPTKAEVNEISAQTISVIEGKGYLTEETEPAFNASPAKDITSEDITDWNNKSDFSGDYDDLTNKPENVSAFNNDAGYLTEHQSLADYYTSGQTDALLEGKQDAGDYATNSEVASAVAEASGATVDWVQSQHYLTEHQSLADYYTSAQTDSLLEGKQDAGNYVSASTLENYYTSAQTDSLLDEKADTTDIPDVSGYIDDADYDSNEKKINFYHGNTLIAYIDATAFIKDGMVTDVTISNGYLVITFNTDSGQEPISIPLTDIFDPSNYYTTNQTDALLNQVSGATIDWVQSQHYLTQHQSLANYYTSAQTDNLLAGKQNAGNYVSASTLSNYYTSGQTDALLEGKQDAGDYATNSEVESAVAEASGATVDWVKEQNYLTEHQSLTDYYTSGQTDALLEGKQDVGDYATNSDVESAVSTASGATIDWVQSQHYLTEHQSLADYYTSGQTNALLEGKQDSGNYVSASTLENYYTSGQTDTLLEGKQDSGNYVSASTLGNYYTSAQTDTLLEGKQAAGNYVSASTLEDYYTSAQTDNLLEGKQDSGNYVSASTLANYYTSGQTDALLEGKQDAGDYATNSDVESAVDAASGATIDWVKEQHYATSQQSLEDYYTSAQTDNLLEGKQDAGNYVSASTLADYYTSGQTDSLLEGKQNAGNYVSASTLEDYYTSAQTDNLLSGKQAAGNYVSASTLEDYYTSAQTDSLLEGKQAAGNYVSASTLNNYYTSAQTDTLLEGKQAAGNYVSASTLGDYYTSGQTDNLLSGKQAAGNYVSASTLNNYYTSGQTDTLLSGKQDAASAVTGYDQPYVIRVMTQAQYDQITPDNGTIYIING